MRMSIQRFQCKRITTEDYRHVIKRRFEYLKISDSSCHALILQERDQKGALPQNIKNICAETVQSSLSGPDRIQKCLLSLVGDERF